LLTVHASAQLRIAKDHVACTYGLKDSSNTWVVEPIFMRISPEHKGSKGYFVGSYEGNGYLDKTGKEIIPPIYGSIQPIYTSFNNHFIVYDKQDRGGVIEVKTTGKINVKIPLQYKIIKEDHDYHFLAYTDSTTTKIDSSFQIVWKDAPFLAIPFYGDLSIAFKSYEKFKRYLYPGYHYSKNDIYPYGLANKAGKLIYPIEYRKIAFCDGSDRVFLFKNRRLIVEDRNRKVLQSLYVNINAKERNICSLCEQQQKVWPYYENKKVGLVNCLFEPLTDPIYDDVNYYNGNHYIQLKKGKKWGLFNLQGEQIIPCLYKTIIGTSRYWQVTDLDDNLGLLDQKGKTIIPCRYKAIYPFKTDHWFVKNKQNKWGAHHNEQIVLPVEYDSIERRYHDNMVRYLHKGKKRGLFSFKTGTVTIPVEYEKIEPIFNDGSAFICTKGNTYHVYNGNKHIVSPPCLGYHRNETHIFFFDKNNIYSSNLTELSEPQKHPTVSRDDNIWFVESLGVDTNANLAFTQSYYNKKIHWSNQPCVTVNDNTFLIGLHHQYLMYHNDTTYTRFTYPIKQRAQPLQDAIKTQCFVVHNHNYKTGVWNAESKKFVIPLDYPCITPWKNSQYFFAHRNVGNPKCNETYLFNQEGQKVFPHRFKHDFAHAEQPLWVEYNQRKGFIDPQSLEWLIPPIYKEAAEFHQGSSLVTTPSGNTGFIDKQGAVVVDTIYKSAYLRWSLKGTQTQYYLFDDANNQPILVNRQNQTISNTDDIVTVLLKDLNYYIPQLNPSIYHDKILRAALLEHLRDLYYKGNTLAPKPTYGDWYTYHGWDFMFDSTSSYSFTTRIVHNFVHGEQFITMEDINFWKTYVNYQGIVQAINLIDLFENEAILLEELTKAIQARDDLHLDCSTPENWLYQIGENFSLSNEGIHLFLVKSVHGDYDVFTIPWKNLVNYKAPINLAPFYINDAKMKLNRQFIQASQNWANRILFFTYNALMAGPIYGIW